MIEVIGMSTRVIVLLPYSFAIMHFVILMAVFEVILFVCINWFFPLSFIVLLSFLFYYSSFCDIVYHCIDARFR